MRFLRQIQKVSFKEVIQSEYFSPHLTKAIIVTIAYIVPVLFYQHLHKPELSVYAALTAQLVTSARFKNTYVQKTIILVSSILAIMLLTFVATLIGDSTAMYITCMCIIAAIAALCRGIGDYGVFIGLYACLIFLFATLPDNNLSTAIDRCLSVGLGGGWGCFLTLIIWPLAPNKPFFTLIATPWLSNSKILKIIKDREGQKISQEEAEELIYELQQDKVEIMESLRPLTEDATISKKDNKLIRSTLKFHTLLAALDTSLQDLGTNDERLIKPVTQLLNMIGNISKIALAIGDTLMPNRRNDLSLIRLSLERNKNALNVLRRRLSEYELNFVNTFKINKVARILELMLYTLGGVFEAINTPNIKKNYNFLSKALYSSSLSLKKQISMLSLELHPRSELFLHAVRMCLVTMVASFLSRVIGIDHGHWIVLSVLIILQPDYVTTRTKSWQRVLGTLVGAIFGSVLMFIPLPLIVLDLIIALCVFTFVLSQDKNYTLAVAMVTAQIVALIEANYNLTPLVAIFERVISTIIGGGLAILAAFLLWPRWQQLVFRPKMQAAIQANREYLLAYLLFLLKKSETTFTSKWQKNAEALSLKTFEAIRQIQLEPSINLINIKTAELIAFHNLKLTRLITELSTIEIEGLDEESIAQLVSPINTLASGLTNLEEPILKRVSYCVWLNPKTLTASPQNTDAHNGGVEISSYAVICSQLELIITEIVGICHETEKLHRAPQAAKKHFSVVIREFLSSLIISFLPPKPRL